MVEQTFIDEDDVVISKTSFEYFEELIKFREAYSEAWDKWQKKKKGLKN